MGEPGAAPRRGLVWHVNKSKAPRQRSPAVASHTKPGMEKAAQRQSASSPESRSASSRPRERPHHHGFFSTGTQAAPARQAFSIGIQRATAPHAGRKAGPRGQPNAPGSRAKLRNKGRARGRPGPREGKANSSRPTQAGVFVKPSEPHRSF